MVSSTGLTTWIGHRKEIWIFFTIKEVFNTCNIVFKPKVRVVCHQSWCNYSSFLISLRWQIYIINPADKTKLSCNTIDWQHHSLDSEDDFIWFPLFLGHHASLCPWKSYSRCRLKATNSFISLLPDFIHEKH